MKKKSARAVFLGTISGALCIIAPNGSYNDMPVTIYQHPFNITVFYLIYFAVQSGEHCEQTIYDIRFRTVSAAKIYRLSGMVVPTSIYIAAYFVCSCTLSYILDPENHTVFLAPFSVSAFGLTTAANLTVLNIFYVNLIYLTKRNTIFFTESAIVLSGLALCFSAPAVIPYICIWYYGVYPKPEVDPALAVSAYLIWTGISVLTGVIPINDVLRRE